MERERISKDEVKISDGMKRRRLIESWHMMIELCIQGLGYTTIRINHHSP